jgi:hypothetical protein
MIFVVEHGKAAPWQLQILVDVDEIDTTQFESVRKIFLCETMEETAIVVDEMRKDRFK